ncbi:MAG: hypothetical protein IT195_12000 [Microthrixaceae bacterium]|nr:hypothetical protein [Microthrixaceae bacterium]
MIERLRALSDKAIKRLVLVWDLTRVTPWRQIRRLRDPSSDLVVWLHHRHPGGWAKWVLQEDTVVKDVAILRALCRRGLRFRIVTGDGIESLRDARVLYTLHWYNPDRLANHSASLMAALRRAEERGNTLLPSADEAEWWENKVFMHRRFDELGVNCPRTWILDSTSDLESGEDAARAEALPFPVLAKEPHSQGSAGVHKVDSVAELRALRSKLVAAGEPELLVQDLIDMRRDLRATCVGGEVVHHYFRINTSGEWTPTSTRRGSLVDFETFPEQWRGRIVDVLGKCGLRTGAFDICWEGDDLESEPIFLEVSPSYTPNPPPPPSFSDKPYYAFKKQLRGPDSYPKRSIETVAAIVDRVLQEYGL